MCAMKIEIIPALNDNYMYLLIDGATREAAVVDPVDPDKVIDAVLRERANLTTVLTTHHHSDHAGGNEDLVRMCDQSLDVYGGDYGVPAITHKVADDQILQLGQLNIRCIRTPCHTKDSVCYFVQSHSNSAKCKHALFSGDTLFQAGCGRFFEGTAHQMHDALYNKFGCLPTDTKVYCGHEYTVKNLTYAQYVEPYNVAICERLQWAKSRCARQLPTVPSTLEEETKWNPFLRVHLPQVQMHARTHCPVGTMKALRKEKDEFVYF